MQPSRSSAADVVERAAAFLGKPVPAKLIEAFDAADVMWDWQLSSLSDGDFEQLGCSLGMKAAIRHALRSTEGLTDRSVAELPEEMRRFLLVPEPNGCVPPRLRDLTCLFYSVVLQESPKDTQQSLFSLGEVFAVMSGLTLALPISLRRQAPEDVTDLRETPALAQAIDIISALTMTTLALCTVVSCVCALFSQLGESAVEASFALHLRLVRILGQACLWWSISINLLMVLVTLYTYYATGLLAAATAVGFVFLSGSALILDLIIRRVLAPCYPLELLHLPYWWRVLTALTAPSAACVLLGDVEAKHLDAAQIRAVRLLRRAGFEAVPTAGRMVSAPAIMPVS